MALEPLPQLSELVIQKAITIRQPYATALALGLKKYETRKWFTDYDGWIAIHSGKNTDSLSLSQELIGIDEFQLPLGAIVAVAKFKCFKISGSDIKAISDRERRLGFWYERNYAWKVTDLVQCNPVEVLGTRGLWFVHHSLEQRIKNAIYEHYRHGNQSHRPIASRV